MTAIFRIDQPAITGGKPPVGTWNMARADLDLFGDGGAVQFTAQDVASSYLWQLISEVDGSAITLGTPTAQTATADILVTGGYLIRLTTDEGLSTKDIRERYFGVPLPGSGLPIPALSETLQDNRDTAHPGYERKMTAWMKYVEASLGGGGGVFEEPVGPTLSTLRTGSGGTVLSDFTFSAGAINTINGNSHYSFVYGGHTSGASANELIDSPRSVVFGYDNVLETADWAFIHGVSNNVWGYGPRVLGHNNVIGTALQAADGASILGNNNEAYGNGIAAIGNYHSADAVGEYSTLCGQFSIPRWAGSLYHAMNPALVANRAGQYIVCSHLSAGTADETPEILDLATYGATPVMLLTDRTVYLFELQLIARTADSPGNPSSLKTWTVRFTVYCDADGNAVMYSVDKVVNSSTAATDEAAWDVVPLVNISLPSLEVFVTGSALESVQWYGVLSTVYFENTNLSPA